MMNEMMAECCGDDGKPDAEQMKSFMKNCDCCAASRSGAEVL